jgi:hypothetical protein
MSSWEGLSPLFPKFARPYSFFHIGLKPPPGTIFLVGIQKSLEAYLTSLNGDWFRYAAQNYVVWTNLDASELAQGIRGTNGLENLAMLITPFSPERANGFMPQEFWTWLNKARFPKQTVPGIPGR